MSTKSVAALKPVPLPNTLTQNNAEARADIVRNLSASAAWVVGYTLGGDELDTDTPNTAPRSPMSGQRGHTHSGGADGKPMFRSIASASLDDFGTYSVNVETQIDLNNLTEWSVRAAGTPLVAPIYDPGDGSGVYVPMGPPLPIWVPGCDPREGAYVSLGWRVHLDVRTNTNVAAGDVLTLRITNTTTGASAEDTLTGLDSATFKSSLASDSETLSVNPGAWNVLQVSGELVADATAGIRDLEIALLALELGVYQS
jgi:hypothetical protein